MITHQQQQTSKPLCRKQKFILFFWQGYFFAIGVGGTILNIHFFLLKYYRDPFLHVLTFSFMTFGIYGFFVGKSAGSVWKLQKSKKESFKKSSFFHAILLSVPLIAFQTYSFHLTLTTGLSSVCLIFFIAKGIRSGLP
jgi:hypothetical protein